MRSNKCLVQAAQPICQSAVCVLFLHPRMLLDVFAARGMLLVLLVVYQDSQGLFCRATPQSVSPQPILPPRTLPSQLQDFVFILVKFHKVLVCPFLQLIMVSLNGRAALKHIDWSSQFHGICRVEKSALHDWSLATLNETCPRIDPCTILLVTRLHVESDLIRFLLIW